jgi:hypothetical protein
MARGWESKSVEAQQEQAAEISAVRPRLTPEQQQLQRQKEGLILSRKRIAEQLAATQNPRYQQSLQQALSELDERISSLPAIP